MSKLDNHYKYLDQMVRENNMEAIFSLENHADFSFTLHEVLMSRYDADENSLNEPQLNLFLIMHLENAGQADHILSFLQEWFPNYAQKVVKALHEIGATNSARIIQKAVDLLPEDKSWFYDTADEAAIQSMDVLDEQFSDYPDGFLRDLYRNYANHHKEEIIQV